MEAERYSIIDSEGEPAFHSLRNEWEILWRQSTDATQSQTWHWQYMYWKHLAPRSLPVIVAAYDSHGNCVALAAFFVCRDQSSWVSKAAFLGDKMPDYHLILAQPNLPQAVGRQMLEHVTLKFKARVSLIELSNIPLPSFTGSIVQEFAEEHFGAWSRATTWNTQTYSVPLPQTLEEYLRLLGPRTREDFRYDRRRLLRTFSVEFRAYGALESLDEALEAIEMLDRSRWGVNSAYAVSSQRHFHRSLARALSEMGIYRAFVLYLDGKPAAYVSGAAIRRELKVMSIAHDRSVPGKYSIGNMANFYSIEHCIQHGYKEYDLTRGSEEYKKWLGALPHTNLHVRLYRSPFDELMDSGGKRIISFLRNRPWLRKAYRVLLRK